MAKSLKVSGLILITICLLNLHLSCKNKNKTIIKVDGLVPDQKTAIKIAEAVWLPIYGKKIYDEEPFIASLTENGNWMILGSIHGQHGGGELMIILQPKDGKIIFAGRDPGK
ncbi:NTF2 fold immunity protein [Mucilaginibacter kameinonensis]|uniref:NTF2 fold immunity protein n=1 Tax=Mucilaginibacter kameinonensis TaxID=452286 RepID=UPI0013CF124E|nr:NTF2 fold immunity protein [Mucilaginibacter kameinonensis]